MAFLAGFFTAVILAVLGALAVIYGGLFNVAATDPHNEAVFWALSTTMRNSVELRAADIAVPEDLREEARWKDGFGHYDTLCRGCHGAPGMDPSPVGQGLRPNPPDLAETVPTWSAGELFWILDHGIKMTGMPAFGPTHREEDLWSIVAFLERLPDMPPEEYRKLVQAQEEPETKPVEEKQPQAQPAVTVEMTGDLRYAPETVTVTAGDTVKWTNVSSMQHTVTADAGKAQDPAHVQLPPEARPFDSGMIRPEGAFTHRFEVPGTYRYFCIPHEAAGMVGTVRVKAKE